MHWHSASRSSSHQQLPWNQSHRLGLTRRPSATLFFAVRQGRAAAQEHERKTKHGVFAGSCQRYTEDSAEKQSTWVSAVYTMTHILIDCAAYLYSEINATTWVYPRSDARIRHVVFRFVSQIFKYLLAWEQDGLSEILLSQYSPAAHLLLNPGT